MRIGWYILFRVGEIIGICRLIYFLAVERKQMGGNHRNLRKER